MERENQIQKIDSLDNYKTSNLNSVLDRWIVIGLWIIVYLPIIIVAVIKRIEGWNAFSMLFQ